MAVVYFLAAQLGLALRVMPEGIALLWPASGIAAGVAIALGRRSWCPVALGVVLATIAANLMIGRCVTSSIAFAACNAGEALLIALLIERWVGGSFQLDTLRHVLAFLVVAVIAPAAVAVGAASTLKIFDLSPGSFGSLWQTWLLSDAIGIAAVAPVTIGFLTGGRRHQLTRSERIGLSCGTATFLITVVLISLAPPHQIFHELTDIGLSLSLLLIAATCAPKWAGLCLAIISLTVIASTAGGVGQFGNASTSLYDRVLAAQLFIVTASTWGLLLAALFEQHRQQRAELIVSKARLGALAQLSADWFWEQDENLRFVELSDNFLHMTGSAVGPVIGLTRWELPTVGVSPAQWAAHRATLERRAPFRDFEFRGVNERGETNWRSSSGEPIFDAEGRFTGYRGTGRNITERKRIEAALEAHRFSVARNSRLNSAGILVGAVAHEINQPLTAASTYLETATVLLDGGPGKIAPARDVIEKVTHEVAHATAIVRGIRTMLQPDSRVISPADLHGTVQHCFDRLRSMYAASQVEMKLAVAPNFPNLMIDPFELELVLINLLRNALEAIEGSANSKGVVTVEAEHSNKGMAEIRICDTGPGFPTLESDDLPIKSTKNSGMGLGLTLSRSIVEAHGGQLRIRAGHPGAVIQVTIPTAEGGAEQWT